MADNKIYFKHPQSGAMKEAPVGFSWTTFFFGFFPALIRGDWKWGIIQFIVAMLTMGFSGLVFCFIYNKLYIKELIQQGFQATKVNSGTIKDIGLKIGQEIPDASETSTNISQATSATTDKTCPHCAETIKAEAKLCKHCRQELQPA